MWSVNEISRLRAEFPVSYPRVVVAKNGLVQVESGSRLEKEPIIVIPRDVAMRTAANKAIVNTS